MLYKFLILFCAVLSIESIHAQIAGYEIEFPYSKDVSRIVEDSQGYMWFHNEKDFYRYNGHQVETLGLGEALGKKKFDYNFTGDLVFTEAGLLFEDDESLWSIDPKSSAVLLFWEIPNGERIDHYYEDDQGGIWVFASSKTETSRPVYQLDQDGSSILAFDLYDHIASRGIFWDFEINDAEGVFYIHWRLGGLKMIDFDGSNIDLEPVNKSEFAGKFDCSLFRLDNKNRLWRIYESEFSIFDFSKRTFDVHPISRQHMFWNECNKSQTPALLNLRFLYEDRSGNIWLACAASYLVMYDKQLTENLLFRKPLVDELEGGNYDIFSLTEDRNGNLWGSKKGGIFKIRKKDNYFNSYAKDTKNPDHDIYKTDNPVVTQILDFFHEFAVKNTSVHSISEDRKGDIYFQDATFTFKIDKESNELSILPIFTKKEKVFLSMEEEDRLVGVFEAYYKIDQENKIKQLKVPINKIENLFHQKNGRIWLSGLLNLHDFMFGETDSITHEFLGNYTNDSGIDFNKVKVNSIQEDEKENLWLGTNEGLLYVDLSSGIITNFDRMVTWKDNTYEIGRAIDQIYFTGSDKLWFKSKYEVGLLHLGNKVIEHLLPINSTISGDDVVFVPEGDSVLWLGENQGLWYHNFKTDESFRISREEGIETEGKVIVMKKIRNDHIAVGTNNGLYLFSPSEVLKLLRQKVEEESKARVDLLSYEFVDGGMDSTISVSFLAGKTKIKLDYNDKSLSLTYATADFKYPRRHLFRHKLVGYESEWSIPHFENKTAYTSLPAGNYTFMLEGNIGNGNWTGEALEIPIHVSQAWFRTWWFILASFILFGSLIFFGVRNTFRQKLERRLEIERLRTRISSDLHDDVGSMLSGLAMESEVMSLQLNDEDKKTALGISEMSRNAIEKMRDIVWAMDSRRDKYENLLDRMRSFALNTLSRAEIKYSFEVNRIIGGHLINPDQRQNIYLIFKEALTNIVKHSNGDFVHILLERTGNELILIVHDNGTVKVMPRGDGLGLSNMKMRAKRLGGGLQISDVEGFEVKLTIPQ